MQLDETRARQFAALTLGHLGQRYPYKLDLVLNGPEDLREPADLHPIFHGSFDWHSCVHGWWQVLRLARRFPDMPEAADICERADLMLVPRKVAGEVARLDMPFSAGFERPYGWGWLLALHNEAAQHDADWGAALEPLALRFAAQSKEYLPKLTYPITVGTHFNTAFALIFAHEWSRERDPELHSLIEDYTNRCYAPLSDYGGLEPGGDEFLSPALVIALLLSKVQDRATFARWFDGLLPNAAYRAPARIFTPATVSDRSDGKIAHLDGLNLSRAWCFRGIAGTLDDPALSALLKDAAQTHLDASLPHLADDYMGTHWLASFALLALDD